MRRLARLVCLLVLVFAAAPTLSAQGPDPGSAPSQFEPVRPGDLSQEQLPAAPLVFAAYAFVWFALVSYVFMLWRRLMHVERELAALSSRLSSRRP
jgi:CcmD family protein